MQSRRVRCCFVDYESREYKNQTHRYMTERKRYTYRTRRLRGTNLLKTCGGHDQRDGAICRYSTSSNFSVAFTVTSRSALPFSLASSEAASTDCSNPQPGVEQ
jgi:hypothetical protein